MREVDDVESMLKDGIDKTAAKMKPITDPIVKQVGNVVEIYDGDELKAIMPAKQFKSLQENLKK